MIPPLSSPTIPVGKDFVVLTEVVQPRDAMDLWQVVQAKPGVTTDKPYAVVGNRLDGDVEVLSKHDTYVAALRSLAHRILRSTA